MDRQLRNNFVSLGTVFIYFSLCNATCVSDAVENGTTFL